MDLRTGAQWSELPRDKFPPYQTCHRRFQQWVRAGTLVQVLRRLAEDLLARGQLDLGETFIDASFSGAKKGAVQLVQHAAAKGARSWQSRTAMVFLSPWGLQALRRMKPSSSKPRSSNGSHEKSPRDLAYDCDPLDQRLRRRGVRLIAPHKSNRVRPKTQDGRELRRYCRRWKIERLFAWLHNFRRLVIRWEYYEANFLGLVQLGCLLILMRNYLWDGL